jgi:glycosyltransferase involved in cell wall biosynthesis
VPKTKSLYNFFSRCEKIIANSHAAKEILRLKWDIEKEIDIVENPRRSDIPISKTSRKFPGHGFKIGFIGRLVPFKGTFSLIKAFDILKEKKKDAELFIAGEGQEMLPLSRIAQDSVHFLGPIRDVKTFYDSLDLLVVPSVREPLGLVALEAQARGVPVIASRVDGLPEAAPFLLIDPTLPIERYVEWGGTLDKMPDLVYDPSKEELAVPKLINPEELACLIESLIDNPARYEEESRRALSFAEKRSNIVQYSEKLLTFIS